MNRIRIRSDFPGGNIRLISVAGNSVQLEQDMRDSTVWWFYWSFCVEEAPAGELVFSFMNGEVVGPWGPAFSRDGITWEWLGKESIVYENGIRQGFRYTFSPFACRVFFCFSLPYGLHHFETFYQMNRSHPLVSRRTLTLTEKGREVPVLSIGCPEARSHVVLTARHHACESTASYLLEGLISFFLEDKEFFMCKEMAIHIMPFVDLDGVEQGDQGKSRHPHDHNRDYLKDPVYSTTSAIMKWVEEYNVIAGIDFHSPWKWGDRNDYVFLVKSDSPAKEEAEKLSSFLKASSAENEGKQGIVYSAAYDVDMGVEWNIPGQPTFSTFLSKRGVPLVCAVEFPYFGVDSMVFTQQSCKKFGRDFGKALGMYLGVQKKCACNEEDQQC